MSAGWGAVNVLYGSACGPSEVGDQIWHQDVEGVTGAVEASDGFGFQLYAANFGDGSRADLAVGAPFESLETGAGEVLAAGSVNVLYGFESSGLSAGTDDQWHQSVSGVGPAGEEAEGFDYFGWAVG
jgi:hypothetical protein